MRAPARTLQWRIDLPFLTPPLMFNKPLHRFAEYRKRREVKDAVLLLCRAGKLPKGLDRVHVELHFTPKVVRTRDSDGPTPTLKPALDGIVAYGLVADDSSDIVSSECVIDPVDRSPLASRVYLLITDLTERG